MSDNKRGFAALSPEERKIISSKGGRAAQDKGTAYKFSAEKAKEAGRKGGLAHAQKRRVRSCATGEVDGSTDSK